MNVKGIDLYGLTFSPGKTQPPESSWFIKENLNGIT